jgi:hypothetical protein
MAKMADLRRRLNQLEQAQRERPRQAHFLWAVPWPTHLDYADVPRWVEEELPCACGLIGGEQLRIGFLGPERIEDPDAWYQHYQAEAATSPEQQAAERQAWYDRYRGGRV